MALMEFVFVQRYLHGFCTDSLPNRNEKDMFMQRRGPGICRFGHLRSSSYGWKRVNGDCQPVCKKPCINGVCVAPDHCFCHKGYKGRQCSEDINECGLHSRPCSHSCMNTAGSFLCFCDTGYILDADGNSCIKQPDCSGLCCQLGCQIGRNGAPACQRPPGFQLALDNRTCKDINECEGPSRVCSERQACRNTFGSYTCVCRSGFVLGTFRNSITCRDEDECVTGLHHCSRHSQCVNTIGSYTCRCEDDYDGDGLHCWKRTRGRPQIAAYVQNKLSEQRRMRDKAMKGANVYF